MPTLHWIGKEKIINHHLDVPFRTLQPEHTHGESDSGNRIIHGDNLEALKALLPEYEGRVKCIYIDPPYNTGNEGWAYNDNVSDPRLLRWLHKTVGKEGEDLSRHDKWLCMMYPRLRLLHKLLAEDGAIFISIDDNEQAHLRLIMDEIFGAGNFVCNILWQKKYAVANDHKSIAPMHDFVVVYQKSQTWQRVLLPRTEEKDSAYKFRDEEGEAFRISDYTCNKSAEERPNLYYPIMQPNTGEEIWPKKTRVWGYSKELHLDHVQQNLVYWGKDGLAKVPSIKRYKKNLKNSSGIVPSTWWPFEFAGHTDIGRKEFRAIFSEGLENVDFQTPKPSTLIERILQISTKSDSIVLDSFAGSGTTAHAILNLNQQDGGNRRFILIEMEDYADTLTAERVRRVIDGYGDKQGTGGGFDFYTLGEPLFDEAEYFHPDALEADIRRYVWHAETREPWPAGTPLHPWLLGTHDATDWWFCYHREQAVALDLATLSIIRQHRTGSAAVAYADYCTLPDDILTRENLRFKKIPRDVPRL